VLYSSAFYRDDADELGGAPFEPVLERRARLVQLSPIAAVRAWLRGDFGRGDEDALCTAIRRDPAVALTDDEIVSVFYEVLGEDDFRPTKAEVVLTVLREAVQFRLPERR
jgi:hypothetical protein